MNAFLHQKHPAVIHLPNKIHLDVTSVVVDWALKIKHLNVYPNKSLGFVLYLRFNSSQTLFR